MQYEVTCCVHAKQIYHIVRIDHVSFGLTHLVSALEQPRMSEYLLRQRQIQRHQENRPVNGMETNDIFTDQMQICRPVLIEQLA